MHLLFGLRIEMVSTIRSSPRFVTGLRREKTKVEVEKASTSRYCNIFFRIEKITR